MEQSTATRTGSSLSSIVAIVGGCLTVAGVAIGWFSIAGQTLKGTEHWSGWGALGAGIVVIFGGMAALDAFVKEARTRRTGGMAAAVGGIIVLFCVGAGFIPAGGAAFGLYVSGVGGIFGAGGGYMAMRAEPES